MSNDYLENLKNTYKQKNNKKSSETYTYISEESLSSINNDSKKDLSLFEHENIIDPWVGFDLDGTLAKYDEYSEEIGEPIQPILNIAKELISQGTIVKIFTARAYNITPTQHQKIRSWLLKVGLPDLEITNIKDPGMQKLYDDRSITVEKNTGKILTKT